MALPPIEQSTVPSRPLLGTPGPAKVTSVSLEANQVEAGVAIGLEKPCVFLLA